MRGTGAGAGLGGSGSIAQLRSLRHKSTIRKHSARADGHKCRQEKIEMTSLGLRHAEQGVAALRLRRVKAEG